MMEIRKPDYVKKRYTISMKYLCARLGIKLDDIEVTAVSYRDGDYDEAQAHQIDIWTEEHINKANTFS